MASTTGTSMMSAINRQLGHFFRQDDSQSKWKSYLGVSVLASLGALALHAAEGGASNHYRNFSAGFFLAGASLFAGILIGFIFGIPKTTNLGSNQSTPQDSVLENASYNPNTNLEEVSDWLTKMLIGVGLLTGYLWTRLLLVGDFIEKDPRKLIADVIGKAGKNAMNDPGIGNRPVDKQVVSREDIRVAEEVAKISSSSKLSLDDLNKQIQVLADKYESLRATMESGAARTREMEIVATQMRGYALAAYQLLRDYAVSESPGKRLAAIAFLETKPDHRYLEWLSERFREEVPFLQYHAAIAMRNASHQASSREQKEKLIPFFKTALNYALQSVKKYNGNERSDEILILKDSLAKLGAEAQ